jgi:hypothetical protein
VIIAEPVKEKEHQLLLYIQKSKNQWMNIVPTKTESKVYFKVKDVEAFTPSADEICVGLLLKLTDPFDIDLQLHSQGEPFRIYKMNEQELKNKGLCGCATYGDCKAKYDSEYRRLDQILIDLIPPILPLCF